jgi:O-antigen ligase
MVCLLLCVALAAGAVAALFPMLAGALLALAIGIVPLALFIRSMSRGISQSRGSLLTVVGLTLIFFSLIRIADRDPTSTALGIQAMFEFALQGAALGLIFLGLYISGERIRFSGAALLWIAFGTYALFTAFWAPQPMLTMSKGVQFLALVVAVTLAASRFEDRYQGVRFFAWLVTFAILGSVMIQVALSGPASLLEAAADGRTRLHIFSIHPIALGILSSMLALILLVNKPRGIDWIPVPILIVVTVLTAARAPLGILLMMIVVYAMLRSRINFRSYLGWASIAVLAGVFLLVGPSILPSASGDSGATATLGQLERDITTLNGRIPVWQAVLDRANSVSDQQMSIVIGHGYGSFRLFGLDLFAYGGDAHNALIQVFAELGFFGATLWVAAIGACFKNVWRTGNGTRDRMILSLPIVFIVGTQMMDASMADSRSFVLVVLLFYSHIAWTQLPAGTSKPVDEHVPALQAARQRQLAPPLPGQPAPQQ